MSKRILVPVNRTMDVERVLTVVRGIARTSGATVRLVAVIPIPEPLRDRSDRVIVSTDTQIDRLERRAMEELRAMAGLALDGVPVETRVVFGEPAEEIAIEAECFDADLVVVTEAPRWRLRAALAGLMPQGVFGRPFPARVLHMPA